MTVPTLIPITDEMVRRAAIRWCSDTDCYFDDLEPHQQARCLEDFRGALEAALCTDDSP